MARIWYYDEQQVTTPIDTYTAASPLTTLITLPDIYINRLKIRWPKGHNGQTGIYMAQQGSAILPFATGDFIVGTDDEEWFDIEDELQGGLQAVTYNLGQFPHSHWIRVEYMPIAAWNIDEVQIPNIAALPNSDGTLSVPGG